MIKIRQHIIYLFCILLAIIFMFFSFITFQKLSHQQIKEINDTFLQEFANQTSYSFKIELEDSLAHIDTIALYFALCLFIGFAMIFVTLLIYTTNNQKHIVSISQKDALTELYNRDTLIKKIQNSLVNGMALDSYNALFMIDLDGFKQINDTYGHMEGDRVLKNVAVQLSKTCKNKDIVGRLGGDEYMIFMKGLPNMMTIEFFAKQLCKSIMDVSLTNGVTNEISGSIGIAIAPIHGTDFEELYRKSDLALYYAKNNGKNQFYIYSEQLEKQY